jgi:hypothetical protein
MSVAIWRFVLNFKLEVTMSDQVLEKISDQNPDNAPINTSVIAKEQVLDSAPEPIAALASPTFKHSEIELEPALIAELCEVTNDPSQAVNNAIRQWLQRRAIKEADSSRPLAMNPIVPPRGEWND